MTDLWESLHPGVRLFVAILCVLNMLLIHFGSAAKAIGPQDDNPPTIIIPRQEEE